MKCHATGFCKELWYPVIEEMRHMGSKATIICWDYRGHGDSGLNKRNIPVNLWMNAVDLCLLVSHIRKKKKNAIFWGVGHSAGGAICAASQILQPGMFKGLFLIEPIIIPPINIDADFESHLAKQAKKKRSVFNSIEEVKIRYLSKPSSPFKNWDERTLELYFKYAFRERKDGKVELKCSPDLESSMYTDVETAYIWDKLEYLICESVCIIYGVNTIHYSVEWLKKLEKLIPNCELNGIENADHWLPFERPNFVARCIIQFLIDCLNKSKL